jgi:hypothetical protein
LLVASKVLDGLPIEHPASSFGVDLSASPPMIGLCYSSAFFVAIQKRLLENYVARYALCHAW